MKYIIHVLLAVLIVLPVNALLSADKCLAVETEVQQKAVFKKKPRLALALGGGGIRGAAHIGVLKVFEKEGIPVDYVVGNSMGALVGGLFCAGVPLERIQSVLSDGSMQKAYLPKSLWMRIMVKPILGLFRGNSYAGLISGRKFEKIINSMIPENVKNVEDLKIPFSCIAFNLIDGKTHLLSKGPINKLIRASASIPLLLKPVEIDDGLYLDGGIRNNLPTHEARQSGAPVVVSVEIDSDFSPIPSKNFCSYSKILDRVVNATLDEIDREKVEAADIVIRPKLVNIPLLSKDRQYVNEAVHQGEVAAEAVLPKIKELLKQASDEPVSEKLVRSSVSQTTLKE